MNLFNVRFNLTIMIHLGIFWMLCGFLEIIEFHLREILLGDRFGGMFSLDCWSLYRFLLKEETPTGWIWGCISSHVCNHYSLLNSCPVIHHYIDVSGPGWYAPWLWWWMFKFLWCCLEFPHIQVTSWYLQLFCQPFPLKWLYLIIGRNNPVLECFFLNMCFAMLSF